YQRVFCSFGSHGNSPYCFRKADTSIRGSLLISSVKTRQPGNGFRQRQKTRRAFTSSLRTPLRTMVSSGIQVAMILSFFVNPFHKCSMDDDENPLVINTAKN